jgi:homoprotocatechuate degradation regulator HpaR
MSGIRKLPPFEQSLAALTIITRESVIAPMRPILRAFAVTEQQWRALRVINDRGSTDATSVAETACLHPASVARILKELEERKLIVRALDANDRRRAMIILSAEGQNVVEALSRDVIRLMQEFSDRFGAQRLERLENELRALSTIINGVPWR